MKTTAQQHFMTHIRALFLIFLCLSCFSLSLSLSPILMSQSHTNPMLLSPALLPTINNQHLTLKANPSSSEVTEEFGFLQRLITAPASVIKLALGSDWQSENLLSLSHVGWMLDPGSTWDFNRTTAAHTDNPDLTWRIESTVWQTKKNIIAPLMGWTMCTT